MLQILRSFEEYQFSLPHEILFKKKEVGTVSKQKGNLFYQNL